MELNKTFLNKRDPVLDLKEMLYDRMGVLKQCLPNLNDMGWEPDDVERQMLNELDNVQNMLDVIERSTGEPKETK